jgi:hypothetical protein
MKEYKTKWMAEAKDMSRVDLEQFFVTMQASRVVMICPEHIENLMKDNCFTKTS